jgi:hypothetical protein
MKRLVVLLIAGFAMLAIASPALAEDYLSEVANGLKTSPVYIAPGTDGTDANTAADLRRKLNSDDNIVLVILPESAQTAIGDDLGSFVDKLSKAVGSQRIIGLTVGDQAVGYASTLPTGTAEDLMHRAASVSTSNVETLGTFVRNIHQWQTEHPEAKTTKPSAEEDGGTSLWFIISVMIALLVSVGVYFYGRLQRSRTGESRKRFHGPEKIREQLSEIAHLRDDVTDPDLQATLYRCCADIERYFERYSSNEVLDAIAFEGHLDSVLDVLKKYVDVQNHPRDFNGPEAKLRQGKQSIEDFAEYVIESIRNGNDVNLIEYSVNTDILSAQRYR